jgi:hypothetical protein
VLGNVVIGNGIWINPGPRATAIAGNFVRGGDYDGILAFEPSTILRRNHALANHGRGIDAPNGAVDRGRNVARGNGAAPQCVSVGCA